MRIYVDGDACPVKEQIVRVGKKKNIEIDLFIDVNHLHKGSGVNVITVDQGADSVDMAIINSMSRGDVVVTNDYGLAALALGKGGFVMDGKGKEFTPQNIDLFLFERHMHKEIRMSKKRHKGPKKRLKEFDVYFEENFESLLDRILKDNQ